MKQRLYDFIPVKHLCVGMSLCGIVAGTQTAQASPVFGQSSGLELPSPSIYQQSTKQISGIVKDQAGIPVIGANVIVKGTTNGVITGLDGDFLLEVPENATLEISYIGYMTQSIPINGKTTFNIILEEDTQKLDEVVVLGYGAGQRKQDLSASVGVLNNTEGPGGPSGYLYRKYVARAVSGCYRTSERWRPDGYTLDSDPWTGLTEWR